MSERVLWSDTQRQAILEEMKFVLEHPSFKSSRRCMVLLQFLVERVLDSDYEAIKERTLGVQVFARKSGYDTSEDPIVRMTANEIRKRLAQCNEETDHSHKVKIHLNRGNYVPEFSFNGNGATPNHSDATHHEEPLDSHELEQHSNSHIEAAPAGNHSEVLARASWRNWKLWTTALILVVAAALSGLYFFRVSRPDYQIWAPLLHAKTPVLLCVGDNVSSNSMDGASRTQIAANGSAAVIQPDPVLPADTVPFVPFVDVTVSNALSNWIAAHGHQSYVRRSSRLSMLDFQQVPAVLIGGLDNPWSLTLLSNLRYKLQIDPAAHQPWIEDTQNPSRRDWEISSSVQYLGSYTDYGVLTRFMDDRNTGHWILALSGLGLHGTKAAADALLDPSLDRAILSSVGAKKNFQVVVKSSVVRGTVGPPHIVAIYSW